jgi:hypothetical protein
MSSAQPWNTEKPLNFSGPHIEATYVENVRDYYIKNARIVANPHMSDAYVGQPVRNIIPAFSSTILKDITIEKAASLIVLEVKDPTNIGNIILEKDWVLYGDTLGDVPSNAHTNDLPFPKNTPLWKSPQDKAAIIEVNPYAMTKQLEASSQKQSFLVKLNLWFAPSHTNCFIHNKHDFIETHTQIFGRGSMQKFKAQDYSTLYEDMLMSAGFTTAVPFCQVLANNRYIYPWHQYYAETDCVWMAVEYHSVDKA